VTARILAQHGNVIAADFRPRSEFTLSIRFATETLYLDDRVMLMRVSALLDDRPLLVQHVIGDLATGEIATL
jgi:hypothetical protein